MNDRERVYLIHFEVPFSHARHYVGYATDLARRIERHRKGCGSRLLYHVQNAGIRWYVVRTWRAGRAKESALKNGGHTRKFCPVCKEGRDLLRVARRWPTLNRAPLEEL